MRALFPGAPQWAIHSKVHRFWGVCVVIANERKNKLIDISVVRGSVRLLSKTNSMK